MVVSRTLIAAGGIMLLALPAAAFERVRVDFDEITSITSMMTDPDRSGSEGTEQQRIIITGSGSLEFDKSVPEFANRRDLRIRLNMPRGVSARRRNGRNADLLSRAENGHAAACLSFATRVLSNSGQFDLRVVSQASGVAAGRYKRSRETGGREVLVVRLDEDSFEDVTCTVIRGRN